MAQNSLQALSILLVVPSLVQGKLLAKSLAQYAQVTIQQCSNIEQALQTLDAIKPDLLISSMYFSDGDGIDLLKKVRSDERMEHVLFMLASSEERFEVLDPILQTGIVAVLPKPFTGDDIQSALDKTVVYLAKNAERTNHVTLSAMRVLVVDDSRLARRHLIKLLGKAGLNADNIIEAENGLEASHVFNDHSFDVVLSDYNMPVMDGEGLLMHIRAHKQQQNTPVIMITSERSEAKLDSIQRHGVTALLDKPFDPCRLQDLLETCV